MINTTKVEKYILKLVEVEINNLYLKLVQVEQMRPIPALFLLQYIPNYCLDSLIP